MIRLMAQWNRKQLPYMTSRVRIRTGPVDIVRRSHNISLNF